MDLGDVVQFSSHPRPFLLTETYCSNPDCTCNEVFLKFTEVGDGDYPLTNPISFSVRVDLETWQESKPPRRMAEVSGWVREFLQQCPPTRRAEFKASYEEGKRIARRRAKYTMDAGEVLEGALLSYADILTDKSSLSAGGNAYTFDVHYQGRDYLVEDRYCANPSCQCKTVHLEFFESVSQPDGQQRIYQRFLGRVTFAGRLIVEKRMNHSLAEAQAVLSAWWKQCGGDLQLLKERYREVKEIGQRSLDTQPSRRSGARGATPMSEHMSLDDGPAANVRAGRNDPCPCGSGKKYKKCCGRRATLPI